MFGIDPWVVADWRHKRFLIVKEWMDRLWDEPRMGPPTLALPIYYLMQICQYLSGKPAPLESFRIPFRTGIPLSPPWESQDEKEDSAETTPESWLADSPAVATAAKRSPDGKSVRITQEDGSLRLYDVEQRRYVD